MTMQKFNYNDTAIREDGYTGSHGWYWQPSAIAGIVFRALRDNLPGYVEDSVLKDTHVYVSDLFKHDAGLLGVGCHDTIYSQFVKVTSDWALPSVEKVRESFEKTNADFQVEAIRGGYHFYATW